MIQDITFQYDESERSYKATLPSLTSAILEVEQEELGVISIWGNLPGMLPAYIAQYGDSFSKMRILEIKIPDGIEITVKSSKAVISAKLKTND